MDPNRVVRKVMVVVVAFFALVVTLGLVTAPGDPAARPAPAPAIGAGYPHDQLQSDADMTQKMSTPNANTDSQNHRSDGQLGRSRSAGYVAALEAHQADIDRMLAQGNP